jgi:L-alanine-DL-glutamate epimerase-like enolase superfamily enzyme
MKTIVQKLIEHVNQPEVENRQPNASSFSGHEENSRRTFMKKALMGGIAMGGFFSLPVTDAVARVTSNVQKASGPSDLKITDLRVAVITEGGRKPIIRVDTNQGIYGLGEVRDGADERYALFLKSRILGMNPCNVEMVFKTINQFGSHGRQGGGVCAVEMAMWDLCGKAWGVPAWQLLGGRYRDTIRLYADTPEVKDPEGFAEKLKKRTEVQGFTWLKMDLGIHLVASNQDAVVNKKFWGAMAQYDLSDYTGYGNTLHPFTQVQITEKGLAELAEYVEKVRTTLGYEIPLSADHFGHFDVNNSIRFGRAMDKYWLAWLEDMVPWFYIDQWKTVTEALETPTCTGEDIYMLKNGFKALIDARAVDIIHPDLATAGGLLETKRIGDYAAENGVAMAMHMAGSPVCFMANVHCAAATQNFLALEHHSVDVPWWANLVHMTGKKQMIENGFANVPLDSPGLGIELNEEEVKKHLDKKNPVFFDPTTEWDQKRSHDRLWS